MNNSCGNKMPCHTWNYADFCPWGDNFEGCPYISRIEPGETDIAFEWHDSAPDTESYMLHYSQRGSTQNNSLELKQSNVVISGLVSGSDYAFFVVASDGRASKKRFARTGEYRGKVVDYLHPEDEAYVFSGRYLCSPSLVRAPDGRLLASCDVYSNGTDQNLTLLFESFDDGKNWTYVTSLCPCFWGQLFVHNGEVYMLALTHGFGSIIIGKSTDNGHNWSLPSTLFWGEQTPYSLTGFHKAPVAVTEHIGRLWTAFEVGVEELFPDKDKKRGERRTLNFMMSADVNSNLLSSESWVVTNSCVPLDNAPDNEPPIEGNAVVSPTGEMLDILRYGSDAAAYHIIKGSADKMEYAGSMNLPCLCNTKFYIQQYHGVYYLAGNENKRSTLNFYRSYDLKTWEKIYTVGDYSDRDRYKYAFQYPTFFIENNTVYLLSRTAQNGAQGYHDNNCITFHKFSLLS